MNPAALPSNSPTSPPDSLSNRGLQDRFEQATLLDLLTAHSADERARMARDLHEGVGQVLAGTSMLAARLLKQLEVEANGAAPLSRKLVELLNSSIDRLRSMSASLTPLADRSLQDALEQLARSNEANWFLPTTIHVDADLPPLAPLVAEQLYWIAQEASIATARHSRASQLSISLTQGMRVDEASDPTNHDARQVSFQLQDDGLVPPADRLVAETPLVGDLLASRALRIGWAFERKPQAPQGFLLRAWGPSSPSGPLEALDQLRSGPPISHPDYPAS